MARYDDKRQVKCSFVVKPGTGKQNSRWSRVYICNECIELCSEIIEEEFDERPIEPSWDELPKPHEIKELWIVYSWSGEGQTYTFSCRLQSL